MNNCFNYNNKNYSCTVCRYPYGKENGAPQFDCYAPRLPKTRFDAITESIDSLIDEIMNIQLATACGITTTKEDYFNYLNQKVDV